MPNKYCNLDGTKKIKDEYKKINIGFDKVEDDVNKINDDINKINVDINTLDERVDEIITTPAEGVSAQEIIDARGGRPVLGKRFEDIEVEIDAHKADYAKSTSEVVNVAGFGAVGDGVTDDTLAIQNAIRKAKETNRPIYFPKRNEYLTSETIIIDFETDVIMESPILYDGVGTALKIGKYGETFSRKTLILRVKNKTINWAVGNNIGIELYNCYSCNINIPYVVGFTIGARCSGEGFGFAYNIITLGWFYQNKTGLKLTNVNNGWINENLWLNGRFGVSSTLNREESRIGIEITSDDGSYTNNNNNLFIKPCFELYGSATIDPAYALPILITHGNYNEFISCRNESNTKPTFTHFARLLNKSQFNHISVGYSMGTFTIDDQALNLHTVENKAKATSFKKTTIFNTGYLPELVTPYDDDKVFVLGVNFSTYANTNIRNNISNTLCVPYSDHLELRNGCYLGVFIDTSVEKRFMADVNTKDNFNGRFYVACYDENDNIISSDNVHFYGAIPTTAMGGSARQSNDGSRYIVFSVNELVKKVRLCVGYGSDVVKLKSMEVSSLGGTASVFSGVNSKEVRATQPPTTMKHTKGDIIYNDNPTPGGYTGWVCVESGEPGVWKGFGLIES